MVVLDENHRILGLRFRDDRVGEFRVDVPVVLEILRAKRGTHVRDVAQRPQPLVGEASVIAALLVGREPDPPNLVERVVGWHRHAVVPVDRFAIGAAAAMGDPDSRARAHHRLERGDEAAGRVLEANALRRAHVNIRLPVGHGDHVVAVQFAAQRRPERLLVPDALAAIERAILPFEVSDELAQVPGDRPQFGRRSPPRGSQNALAAKQSAQTVHPAAPRELRNDDGDQRDARAERDEEVEEVPAGFLAAAFHEAHVMDEHEAGIRRRVGVHVTNREMQQAAGGMQHMLAGVRVLPERGATDFLGKLACRNGRLAVVQTKPDRVKPLVLEHPVEIGRDPRRRTGQDQVRQRLLDGGGDQARTHVEVAHEPAQHQRIGERDRDVREGAERQEQRNDEPQ